MDSLEFLRKLSQVMEDPLIALRFRQLIDFAKVKSKKDSTVEYHIGIFRENYGSFAIKIKKFQKSAQEVLALVAEKDVPGKDLLYMLNHGDSAIKKIIHINLKESINQLYLEEDRVKNIILETFNVKNFYLIVMFDKNIGFHLIVSANENLQRVDIKLNQTSCLDSIASKKSIIFNAMKTPELFDIDGVLAKKIQDSIAQNNALLYSKIEQMLYENTLTASFKSTEFKAKKRL